MVSENGGVEKETARRIRRVLDQKRRDSGKFLFSEEHREHLSEAQRKTWSEGRRKPNPKSRDEAASRTMKAMIESGTFRPAKPFTSEAARTARAKADNEKIAASLRERNKANIGKPMPPGPGAKGVGHWGAKYFEVLSPDRRVYRFVNMNEFVRQHPGLFAPEDTVFSKAKCRASKGLVSLFQTRNAPLTWKGWRALKSLPKEDVLSVRHEAGTYPSGEMGESK